MNPPSPYGPGRLENIVLVVTILAIGGGLSAFEPNGQNVAGPQTEVTTISAAGEAAKQLVLGVIYLANVGLLLRFVRPWAWRFLGLPLVALLAWCFLSAGWSVMPDGTLRRAAALTGLVVVGLYAGIRFDENRLTRAIAIAAAIATIGSAVWAVGFPRFAFDTDGHLRGLFYHKNAFGSFLAISMLAVGYRIVVLRCRSLAYPLLLGLSLGCFALAHSATPIVAAGAGVGVFASVVGLQRSQGLLAPILTVVACSCLAALVLFGAEIADVIAEILGRSTDLSGRTTIWEFVLPMIAQRPWTGYGYGIFWLGETAPGALFWFWSKQFELHAHDGFLQLLLDAGIVGFILYLASLVRLATRAVHLNRLGATTLVRWIAVYIGFYLIGNITDTELWQANSLMTTLYVWSVTRVNCEAWRLTLQQQLVSAQAGNAVSTRQEAYA